MRCKPLQFFKRLIDVLTLGSEHPLRRLVAYYAFLGAIGFILYQFVPQVNDLFAVGAEEQLVDKPMMLQDGLTSSANTSNGIVKITRSPMRS